MPGFDTEGGKPLGSDIQGTELNIASQAQGTILYNNGTSWVVLAAGTSGDYLQTQGAGANPQWASVNVNSIELDIAQIEINVIELAAQASVTPFDYDNAIVETFISSQLGLNAYIDLANTTAVYDGTAWAVKTAGSTNVRAHGKVSDNTDSHALYSGMSITPSSDIWVTAITKDSSDNSTDCYIFTADGTQLATAAFSANVATLSTVYLKSGTTYYIMGKSSGSTGRRYIGTGASLPINSTDFSWINSYNQITTPGTWGSGSTDRFFTIVSITCTTSLSAGTAPKIIAFTLPTIPTITDTQLVVNGENTMTYDLIDASAGEDDGLALNTKNSFTNVDGSDLSGGTLKVNLTNASSTLTTIILKEWS